MQESQRYSHLVPSDSSRIHPSHAQARAASSWSRTDAWSSRMGQAGRGQACCDDNMQLVTLSAQASSQLKTLYDIILIVRLYNVQNRGAQQCRWS